MYLTKVTVNLAHLNPDSFDSLFGADSYFTHQLLWGLFPTTEKRDFLYRQSMTPTGKESGRRGLPEFYLVSETKPDENNEVLDCQIKKMPERIEKGTRLAFKIRANPTVAKRVEGKARSVRHDVMMNVKYELKNAGETDQEKISQAMNDAASVWIKNQGDRNGFSLLDYRVACSSQEKIRSKKQEISFTSVDYEGVLQVEDEELFARAIGKGIGRSKGFGCGMFMLMQHKLP